MLKWVIFVFYYIYMPIANTKQKNNFNILIFISHFFFTHINICVQYISTIRCTNKNPIEKEKKIRNSDKLRKTNIFFWE